MNAIWVRFDFRKLATALFWAGIAGNLLGPLPTVVYLTNASADITDAITVYTFLLVSSAFFVWPCTLLFGLPTALSVQALRIGRWPALIAILSLAILAAWLGVQYIPSMAEERTAGVDLSLLFMAAPFAASSSLMLWFVLFREGSAKSAGGLEES